MAIGTAAALLGSAVIGAGSSALSGAKASKAASKAAAQNAAIQQQQYNQTRSDLQPYTQLGYGAGGALASRLGLGGGGGGGGGYGAPANDSYSEYLAANPDLAAEAARVTANGQFANVGDYLQWHDQTYAGENRHSFTDPVTGQPVDDGGSEAPTEDMSWQTMERPDAGLAPSFSTYFDDTPSQQYYDELANSTKSINARAGATQGYYSGARAKGLQSNTNQLWNADYDRRWNRANTLYQSALNQYNQNRAVDNATFDTDRTFGANRYDTQTGNLFNLLGIGANATQALAGYGQQNANNQTANNNALAGAKGNAAIATGNAVGNVLGQAASLYGLYGGKTNQRIA